MSESGKEIVEKRNSDGTFEKVEDKPEEDGQDVSNRRRKKVERLQRMGFVVDLKPDMQLAQLYPGVFLGSQDVAAELNLLKANKITHIVNCATGIQDHFPTHFQYLHIDMLDLPTTSMDEHLDTVHAFIDNCLGNNGKVLVHCNAGVSRAATFVLSYIMKKTKSGFNAALQNARTIRPAIRPNDGFIKQLKEYEERIGIEKSQ
ncbi:hypothetical protein WR25_09739 isoform D [Diploscapter pachys]|nr:hypothetical protein WR25_09739 isoform D [Diploscapter pachys]